MFVFACPITAKSQCWLFALRANTGEISVLALKYLYLPSNIRICPHISVFAPEFNFRYLRSGLKVQEKMMHKDMRNIVFQSN